MMNGTFPRSRQFDAAFTLFTKYPTSTTVTGSRSRITWSDVVDSGVNPRFREQIRSHQNASTHNNRNRFIIRGHTSGFTEFQLDKLPGSTITPRQIRRRVAGDILDAGDITVPNLYDNIALRNKANNAALIGFLNKARDAQTALQGGVFVGELRQTLTMIVKPGKAIRKLLNEYSRDIRRRTRRFRRNGRLEPSHIRDANKVISDTWLEYSFGLSPLFADVEGGARALAELATRPHEYRRVSYSTEEFEPNSQLGDDRYIKNVDGKGTRYVVEKRGKQGHLCRITGEVRCEVKNPYLMSKELFGFKPSDFLPTVWELIPYSFLVDYFTNIGDVISAWTFPQQDLTWWSRSRKAVREIEYLAYMIDPINPNPGDYQVTSWFGPTLNFLISRERIERDATTLGLPVIRFQVPGFSKKWLNIAALAHMRKL